MTDERTIASLQDLAERITKLEGQLGGQGAGKDLGRIVKRFQELEKFVGYEEETTSLDDAAKMTAKVATKNSETLREMNQTLKGIYECVKAMEKKVDTTVGRQNALYWYLLNKFPEDREKLTPKEGDGCTACPVSQIEVPTMWAEDDEDDLGDNSSFFNKKK